MPKVHGIIFMVKNTNYLNIRAATIRIKHFYYNISEYSDPGS